MFGRSGRPEGTLVVDGEGRKVDILPLTTLRSHSDDRPAQEVHQAAILADFQTAVRVNDEAARCLRHAEAVAAQAALALVESRKQVRRVSDGTI